jgi:hypothetical protein
MVKGKVVTILLAGMLSWLPNHHISFHFCVLVANAGCLFYARLNACRYFYRFKSSFPAFSLCQKHYVP